MSVGVNIQQVLASMKGLKASDLHLKAGLPPHFPVGGHLRALTLPAVSGDEIDALMSTIIPPTRRAFYDEHGDLDFATELPDGERFRVNIFRAAGKMNAAIRRVNST